MTTTLTFTEQLQTALALSRSENPVNKRYMDCRMALHAIADDYEGERGAKLNRLLSVTHVWTLDRERDYRREQLMSMCMLRVAIRREFGL